MTKTHGKTHAAALATLGKQLPAAEADDALFVVVAHADGRYSLVADQVAPPQIALAAAALLRALIDRALADGVKPPRPLLLTHDSLARLGRVTFRDAGAGKTLQ